MPKADDNYGTYGSVPTVQNQGVSGAQITAHATPEAFGAGVGKAIAGAGKEAADISLHYMQIDSEAKVNDDYANKYVPTATNLKSQYDSLRGQDKVAGYENYINSLKELNNKFTSEQPGVIGQKSMSALINRHIIGEVEGANRELVESQKQFADQSRFDLIMANNGLAARNYNNPDMVESVEQQNNNHITIRHIDEGHDPNHVESESIIRQAQAANTGQMASGMISSAINAGDPVSASNFRSRYASVIPGYQKLAIDNTIHIASIQQTSTQTIKAIINGLPAPEVIGAPPAQVQALVADTAKSSEVDPNHALTVLRIESSDGQNVGSRGTLGQDKESAGKSLDEQAQTLCKNLKSANNYATNALGRPAEPWETYITYQQGAGGGPALLKAAQDNPDAKAIDILTPLYKSPKDALAAINGNGGNVTMSASDFVDHIKQVYTDNERRANCDFSNATTPGDAILTSHQKDGVTIQPAATPTQTLMNFDKKAPAILEQINAIPNYEVRAGVMKAYNQERQRYVDSSKAYSNVLVNQAGQLAADPKFTSMDQVPAELHSALALDHPQTLNYMQTRAEYNLNHAAGDNTKDMREYGKGFYDLFNAVHSTGEDKITSISQLQKHVGKDGDLTISGYDRLIKELQGKNTPEGASEGLMKKQFLDMAKQQISGKDDTLGIKDPKGEENYLRFMSQALTAYDSGKGDGKTATQLLNPDSPDYIGKSIHSFKRPLAQQLADMEVDATDSNTTTPEGLKQMLSSGKISRKEAESIAIKNGFVRAPVVQNVTIPLAE